MVLVPPYDKSEAEPRVSIKPGSSALIGLKWPDRPGQYGIQYAVIPMFKPGGMDLMSFAKKRGKKSLR